MSQYRYSPAFRSRAFCSSVAESVWPGCFPSRLHRSLVRHGRRIGYERLATDPWQLQGAMWPRDEAELAEWQQPAVPGIYPNDFPF